VRPVLAVGEEVAHGTRGHGLGVRR
jgi:hypothetical protein